MAAWRGGVMRSKSGIAKRRKRNPKADVTATCTPPPKMSRGHVAKFVLTVRPCEVTLEPHTVRKKPSIHMDIIGSTRNLLLLYPRL